MYLRVIHGRDARATSLRLVVDPTLSYNPSSPHESYRSLSEAFQARRPRGARPAFAYNILRADAAGNCASQF